MNLKERDLKIGSLRSAVHAGGVDLENARDLLAWVIAEDAWRERVDMYTDERIVFDHFDDFVTERPPKGLGSTVADLERLVAGTAVEDALRGVRKARGSRSDLRNNITQVEARRPPLVRHGTTRAYALDRLRRDRPDLLARVLAGELSANAAAIEAGFRKPKATIPVDSPDAAISALLRRFSDGELRAALDRQGQRHD